MAERQVRQAGDDMTKPRTLKQNSSLWKWDKMMCDYFNRNNMPIQWVLKHTFERRWVYDDFVNLMVKPTLKEWKGIESTRDASTKDLIIVCDSLIDNLTIHAANKTPERIPPWPDRHSLSQERKV